METSESSIVDPVSILSYMILKEEHRWPRPAWRGIYRTWGSVAALVLLKDGRLSFIKLDPLPSRRSISSARWFIPHLLVRHLSSFYCLCSLTSNPTTVNTGLALIWRPACTTPSPTSHSPSLLSPFPLGWRFVEDLLLSPRQLAQLIHLATPSLSSLR